MQSAYTHSRTTGLPTRPERPCTSGTREKTRMPTWMQRPN